MKIAPGEPGGTPSEKRSSTFTGEVWADPVLSAEGTTIATVFFTPGARTHWHQHERGQILQVLAGHGLICTQGATPEPLRPGDTVWIPPGERHWHGGAPESFMTHTAISLGVTQWAGEVTGAEYSGDR